MSHSKAARQQDSNRDRHYDLGVAELCDGDHHRIAWCCAKILERAVYRAICKQQRVTVDDVLKDTEKKPGGTDEKDRRQCESPSFGP